MTGKKKNNKEPQLDPIKELIDRGFNKLSEFPAGGGDARLSVWHQDGKVIMHHDLGEDGWGLWRPVDDDNDVEHTILELDRYIEGEDYVPRIDQVFNRTQRTRLCRALRDRISAVEVAMRAQMVGGKDKEQEESLQVEINECNELLELLGDED